MMPPASIVAMTPARCAALGLPPCAFSVDTQPVAPPFGTVPGAYLSVSGPPGGTLTFDAWPCPAHDDASLAAWLVARLQQPIEAVLPAGRVTVAGEPRAAVAAIAGSGYARALHAAILVRDAAHAPHGVALVAALGLGQWGRGDLDTIVTAGHLGAVLRSFALGVTPAAVAPDGPPSPNPPMPLPPPWPLSSPPRTAGVPRSTSPHPPTRPEPPAAPAQRPAATLPGALCLEPTEGSAPHFHRVTRSARVGRGRGCDIALDDLSVSRDHATVTSETGAWVVRPSKPEADTFVNDARVVHFERLCEGDVVAFGRVAMRVTFGDSPAVLEPPALSRLFSRRGWAVPRLPRALASSLEEVSPGVYATDADAAATAQAWSPAPPLMFLPRRDLAVVRVDDGPEPTLRLTLFAACVEMSLTLAASDRPAGETLFTALEGLLRVAARLERERPRDPSEVVRIDAGDPAAPARWTGPRRASGSGAPLAVLRDVTDWLDAR